MNRKGFTLIELIVVISIIALLSIVGVTSYQRVQRNARDAKRIGDLQEIKKALLVYKSIHGEFPNTPPAESDCKGWDAASHDLDDDGDFFIDELADNNILDNIPRDPLIDQTTDACEAHDGEGFNYYYHRYTPSSASNSTNGCQPKAFVILGADMESSEGRHRQSPGWDECTRDWHENFDYVIGMYE